MRRNVHKNLVPEIKKKLHEQYMTQRKLAEKLGVGEAVVSHWLAGRVTPNSYYTIEIIKILEIDVNDLQEA